MNINSNDTRKSFVDCKDIMSEIRNVISEERVHLDEPMKLHTSFRIGGPAALLLEVSSVDEIRKLINLFKENDVKYFIMGNGSNLLVSDNGYSGIVVKIADTFNDVKIEGNYVKVQAGVLLSTLSKEIAREELIGFEFASGIPGTVGGAISMNAGAYDGEMKDCVESVKVLTVDGEILDLSNKEMNFGYRNSNVRIKNYIVLETVFKLDKGDKALIQEKTADFTNRRTSKQPLTLPSAGSMFKRPVGYYAGKLIDDSGLRGVRIGDAQISEKHCGFVVNRGNATCKQVLELINMVQKVVRDGFSVELEAEVRYLGD